jgi:hypothetical protein
MLTLLLDYSCYIRSGQVTTPDIIISGQLLTDLLRPLQRPFPNLASTHIRFLGLFAKSNSQRDRARLIVCRDRRCYING